jgi:O-antigen/teichoic acid export membrane protein
MLLAAPLVAAWVGSPESTALIRWLAVVPVLRAASSPALVTLQRSLAYRRLAACSLVETVAMFVATLALIPVLDGPWPLVGGIIVGELGRVVASYAFAPHRPRSRFQRARATELLRYGRWVTGSSIALLLLLYMDDAVVAGVLGAASLAVYQLAYQIAGVPASEISMVVGEVAFTSMARIRDEPARLARSFLHSYELVAALSFPVAVALAVTARPLVDVLLGAKWEGAVPVIQILAAWGVMRALGSLTTSMFRAVGRPDIPARHHWRMVACTAVLLVPMVEWFGLVGAATAVLVPNTVIHWLRYRDVADVLAVTSHVVVRRLISPALAAVAMAVVMIAAVLATASLWSGWTVLVAGLAGAVTYGAVVLLLERSGRCRVLHTAKVLTLGASS